MSCSVGHKQTKFSVGGTLISGCHWKISAKICILVNFFCHCIECIPAAAFTWVDIGVPCSMYEFNAAGFEVQVALARGSSRRSILQLLPQARVNISAPILQGQYCSCHRMQLLPCTKPSALQHGHWPWRNSIRDNYLVHITAMHIIWATVGAFVLQYSDHQQWINITRWGSKDMTI